MASSVPQSIADLAVTAMAAANAAAAAAIGSSTSSSPMNSFLSADQTPNIRLLAVYDRISHYLNGIARFDTSEVVRLCYSFAKIIDFLLTANDIPGIAHHLPPFIKKVYEWRKNAALQPAVMMVLISIKNACKRGWFPTADTEELLCMVDEMCRKFCTELCPNTYVSHAFDTISKIMPRFYPHLMLKSIIISFEAKPGYDVLMSDFHFTKYNHPEQKIVLIVVKTENLETSSCIANPQVSFLVNGRGVDKRNNFSVHCGPQLPSDISKMLKSGINILQTIGYFDGTYLIAIACICTVTKVTPALKDYIQPVLAAHDSDSEIIEGPSRILLNCPISLNRMKTPVKGHLCKHHQCFDYDNYLDMNLRKPKWRCPHCNQPVCMLDLRIDRNMAKILKEVGEDVAEVVIQADGSWNVVSEQGRRTIETYAIPVDDQTDSIEYETTKSKTPMAGLVDLTMEEGDNGNLTGYVNHSYDNILEGEDRKPIIDVGYIPAPQFPANPSLANHSSNAAQLPVYQPGNSLQPTFMPSYATNVSLASTGSPHVTNSQTLSSMLGNFVHSNAVSPQVDQTQLGVHALPVINNAAERMRSLSRHAPVAVQAIPVSKPTHNTPRRLHANLLDNALSSTNLSPRQYQTVNISTAPQENFSGGMSNVEMHQIARTADTPAVQDHILNEAAIHQAVGQQSPGTLNARLPFSHRRVTSDIDTFRASLHPSPFSRNSFQTPPNTRGHQPMNQQVTNVPSQSPNIPSAVRQASHNPTSIASSTFGNPRNHHPHAPLPPQFLRSLPSSTLAASRDGSRVLSTDRWRNLIGGLPSLLSRPPDGLPELPAEQNWRPTGRMRGSLSGSDYSAVISNYMPPLNQSATVRPSSAPSTSDQISALIANNLMSHGAFNNQNNPTLDNFGTQHGDRI